ncbi:hypothetical protein H8A95_15740 [Bradyrhizobium sp. Pear76]|uniref:hypothetical protein n=1 Tax=Bradyrhizobium oropedii TaxID=1571201 RepID=UPI001E4DDA0B|nr:hypothetical protein [Bradyrhizobium oropedii]MCC8963722.1 hypothetical protein [Bradyrhizobium oropedii]
MIAAAILFSIEHPIITGILIGAGLIGGPLSVIAWTLGYEHAMRKVAVWMRPVKSAPALEPIHGDVPTLPPVRERRFSSVEHRGYLS